MDLDTLKEKWICPKCRGRGCLLQEVSMSKITDKIILRGGNDKFIGLSCTLCGYTEFYNQKIVARADEKVAAEKPVPSPIVKQADLIEGDS